MVKSPDTVCAGSREGGVELLVSIRPLVDLPDLGLVDLDLTLAWVLGNSDFSPMGCCSSLSFQGLWERRADTA